MLEILPYRISYMDMFGYAEHFQEILNKIKSYTSEIKASTENVANTFPYIDLKDFTQLLQ